MAKELQKTVSKKLIPFMSEKFGMDADEFVTTVKATVFPANKPITNEQVGMFLIVAREYNLNPFIREIYAFPGKSGGIIPIVSIDGWANIINSHPQFDGVEFKDVFDAAGKIESISAKIYRKDRSHPIVVTEYLKECHRNIDTWNKYPVRMLRHKSLIQCARYAFGFAGIYDEDEGERIKSGEVIDITEQTKVGTEQKAKELQDQLEQDESKVQDAEHSDVEVTDEKQTTAVKKTEKKKVEKKTETGIDDQIAALCADIEKIGLFFVPLIRDVTGSDKYDPKITAKKKQDLLTKLKRYYADNMKRMDRREDTQDLRFPGSE